MSSNLVIKIAGDVGDLKKAYSEVRDQTKDLDDGLAKAAKVSGAAFALLTAEVGFSLKAFGESEQASKRLALSMQNQGIYSSALIDSYKQQASELQKLTGIDDDATVSAQAVLQSRIGQTEITRELTLAMQDLAIVKKLDLDTTADLIGKGIEGQTAALKKLGIEVDENASKQQRMKQVIEEITLKFGGQAAAANEGVGSVKRLQSAFGDLQEGIGEKFAPIFEKVVASITSAFEYISENEALVEFAAAVVAGGIALSGLTLALTGAGAALTAATAVAGAFGVTLTVALGPIAAIAAAVTALAAGVGYLAVEGNKAAGAQAELERSIKRTTQELVNLKENARFNGGDFRLGQRIEETSNKLAILKAQLEEMRRSPRPEQDEDKKNAANNAAAKKTQEERLKLEAQRVADQAIIAQAYGTSQKILDLQKQETEIAKQLNETKSKDVTDALNFRLGQIREAKAEELRIQEENSNVEAEQLAIIRQQALDANAEYQAMTDAQQAEFFQKNQDALLAIAQTEQQVRDQQVAGRLKAQLAEHNAFLANQQRFGTSYALINNLMNSEIYQGNKQAAGELAALQSSSNSTLKAIGKAAAVANIAIRTAESAMNIYAGFSTIPIVGPALGTAGAAAAVAFGAEQMGRVVAAADGGLIEGPGTSTSDSINARLSKGELVVPTRNFEEVVNAVALSRGAGVTDGSASGGAQEISVVLSLKDALFDMLEVESAKRDRLNVALRRA